MSRASHKENFIVNIYKLSKFVHRIIWIELILQLFRFKNESNKFFFHYVRLYLKKQS
jgi:hypothetical protein